MSTDPQTPGPVTVTAVLTDGDILATGEVMRKLRPNVTPEKYLPTVRRMLHLDSGVQREVTHRFYFREHLTINAYHFRVRARQARCVELM